MNEQFVQSIQLKRSEIESFDPYPFNLPIVKSLDRLPLHPQVTYIIGENGSGKSTLLEAVAVALGFNPEGGSKNVRFGTRDSHSPLHKYLRIAKGVKRPKDGYFLRAESFFNVATELERLDQNDDYDRYVPPPLTPAYGGVSLHEQSHGESFFALMTARFRGNGLYILDEPESALSPQRQLAVLARMHELIQKKSQFIIATHSPILMAYPSALIYACTGNGITPVKYDDTEHVRVTRDFLTSPERMLRELFADEKKNTDTPLLPD